MAEPDDEPEIDADEPDEDAEVEPDADEPAEDRQELWATWRHETDHQFHYNDR